MNEDIANDQWNEDLDSLEPQAPAEFVGPQQPMTPKEKAKKDRAQRQKVRAIRRTAVKVANNRRPIVSIGRPQVGATMEDFNSILDTYHTSIMNREVTVEEGVASMNEQVGKILNQ